MPDIDHAAIERQLQGLDDRFTDELHGIKQRWDTMSSRVGYMLTGEGEDGDRDKLDADARMVALNDLAGFATELRLLVEPRQLAAHTAARQGMPEDTFHDSAWTYRCSAPAGAYVFGPGGTVRVVAAVESWLVQLEAAGRVERGAHRRILRDALADALLLTGDTHRATLAAMEDAILTDAEAYAPEIAA